MKFLSFLRRNLSFFVLIFGLLAVRWSLADQYLVPSGSMEPTIHVGDHIYVDKMAYDLKLPFTMQTLLRIAEPERGDIVTFLFPKDPSVVFVKRMIGLPGDHIVIDDGFLSINGRLVDGSAFAEQELNEAKTSFVYAETWGAKQTTVQRIPTLARHEHFDFTVPADSYFCMGDNRDNSDDGRSWGFVPRNNLKGKALRVLYSVTFPAHLPKLDLGRTAHELM